MANRWREREIFASEGVFRFRIRAKAWLLLMLVLRVSTGVTADPSVSEDADSILIRPLFVYENLIRGVHDYFNNTCIILFHDAPKTTGLREIDGLLSLQRYFSGTLNIRTSIMDFRTFKSQLGDTYNSIKRPLFVLLNDLEEIREQFARVSRWITMAYPTWLLFLRNDTKYEDFLSEVHVPFDCVFMIVQSDNRENGEVIRDVYRIGKEEDLRWMKFGEWDKERGFRGPLLGLYQRRHDLHGRTIRVVTVQDPPVSRVLRDTANRMVGIAGFFGEVIHLLQEGMNCTFSYTEAASWGVRLPNGTWTGSIKMLMEDEADLAATELMMTSDRLDAVKFTTPVYSTKCRVYIKKPDTMAVKWNAYLAPFALSTWNAIAMTILVVALTISTIDAFSPSSGVPSSMAPRFTISEVMFFVFGALCGQGMESSSLDPIRLAQLSIQLTAVVVLAAYSAALISFLAVKTFVMPFTTMEGMLEDGSYRFAVVGDSADYSFFQNTTDRILAIMFEKLMASETDLPVNYLDGLGRVCRESKYAFMTLDNMATVLQGAVECMLEPLDTMVQTTVAMAHFGAARQRNSSKVDESRVGHALEQAEERMDVGRAGGRDAAAGLLGCRYTRRLAGVARRVADLLAAKRLDHDLRDGSSRLCRRAERRSFAGRSRSAIWSGSIAGVRSTTGCASSRRRRSNVNTQSSFVARPDKRLSLRVGPNRECDRTIANSNRVVCGCNGERMELVPCNAFPAKVQGSSKEHSFPNGKENVLPCTSASATATVKKCKNVALRRRVSLSSNDDRRSELAGLNGRQGHAFGETFSLRKTPFHVHCDDKNVPEPQQKPQPQPRPRRGSIATSRPSASSRDLRKERKQPAPRSEETEDRLSRKPLPDDRYRRNENVLPSKIPRRARSISTESDRRKPLSRDDGNALSRQAISIAPSSSKAVEGVMAAGQAMVDRIRWQERVDASATVQGKGVERRIVDPIDWETLITEVRRDVSSPTRTSVRPRKQPACTGTSKAPPNLFPGELICNAEYHTDLFFVEREKEERAPRLSANFLAHISEHVNAEQRTVIVTFMLHLGTHCRYPSYIVYRAVKLFDAAIDRLRVATALIQMTALASLWITLKTLENAHKIPTASQMIRLAKDLYAGREDLLIEYERKILRALDFNVTFADAHSLLTCHLINSKRCADISNETFAFAYQAGGYVIDLTLLDEMFCRTSASLVAVTAAELVLGLIVDTEQARATDLPAQIRPRWLFWRGLLYAASADAAGSRFCVRFQDEEIDRCRVAMLRRVLSSGRKNSCFEVVCRKYSRSRFGRIAERFLDRAGMLSPLETFDP